MSKIFLVMTLARDGPNCSGVLVDREPSWEAKECNSRGKEIRQRRENKTNKKKTR